MSGPGDTTTAPEPGAPALGICQTLGSPPGPGPGASGYGIEIMEDERWPGIC